MDDTNNIDNNLFVVCNDVFKNINELNGQVTPSLEAYCNEHSANRCSGSMHGDEFLETSVEGHRIWLHPPRGQERKAIEHYILCRNKAPTLTSAIIIVPVAGNGIAMPWTPLLKGMVLLTEAMLEGRQDLHFGSSQIRNG